MTVLAPVVHEPEVIDQQAAGHVRVLCLPSPFTLERRDLRVPEGQTLGEIVRGLNLSSWKSANVAIDGQPVERAWWDAVRPKAGHVVTVRCIPRGGGGDSKGWIQILAGIVLIVVGIVLSVFGYGLGVPLITTGIGLVVGGAVALLTPPPQLPKLKGGSANDQPVFAITGSRNQANPYGAVPRVYGRHRIFPVFGALPFTEIEGNTQYLRELFVLGYGPLALSDLRIGETPLDQFSEVEVEIRQGFPSDPPITLFPGDVFEEGLSLSLATPPNGTAPEPVRVTSGAVDEWSVDFVFQSGLFHINGNGEVVPISTRIQVHYRRQGTTDWLLASDKMYSGGTLQPLRRSVRQVVSERAVYEIRMKQFGGTVTVAGGLGSVTNAATWAVLRSIVYEPPVALSGLCLVALRIKATDQLNGVIDQFNCIAESILPDYDAESGGWVSRPTSNPASIYRDILQGTANARPLADERLDLAALQAWHTECALTGRTFSYVVDQPTTVAELLRQVVAVGRATLGSVDGTFGVVREVLQTVPVQHFTPRNSKNFRGSKLFREIPHAIKARFINPDTGWEIDERFVYDDGFDESNATKFEAIQFFGVTSADQAWRLARYHFAAARLRPEIYEFETDVEHLVCTRGDLVRITHDVPLFGITSGRIKAVTLNGSGEATAITVDEPVPMEDNGTQYDVRIRRTDGASVVAEVVAVEGSQTTLTFVVPIPAAQAPAAGDLFMFGVFGQSSIEAIVTRIEMLRDLGARITCVDAAPALHQADQGTIPPHDPQITTPPELRRPPEPLIYGLTSDGTLVTRAPGTSIGSRVTVHWVLPSSDTLQGATIQAGWRHSGLADEDEWTRMPETPQAEATAMHIGPLTPGTTVDIRLRTVSRFAVASAWVVVTLIELPNPPVAAAYTLEAIVGGYLARLDRLTGPPPPPRVTGLRLVNSISGSPNDTDFAGTEAKVTWNTMALFVGAGDAEDDLTQDTEIRDYLVEILTGGTVRRTASVATPGYTYSWELNLEDHAGVPSRTLTFRVRARSHDGQLSTQAAELTVQNPAPDMSQITPGLLATVEALVVDWKAYSTTDHDLDRFEVLTGVTSPPTVVAATRAASQREAILPGLTAGVERFVRVLPYDAFGAGVPSQIASATPLSAEAIDFFTRSFVPEDIVFAFNPATNEVAWTAGTLRYTVDGTTIETRAISGDSAAWTSGALFVYYILGETEFRTTTSAVVAIGVDRAVMALYTGGTGLVVNWGKALVHGSDILANSIGANQLVTSSAVITGAAQIANAIINNAHISDLQANKITAGSILAELLLATGKIATAASGARVELASGGLDVFNGSGQSVARLQATTPHARIGRSLADGASTPPIELSSSGDLQQFVTEHLKNLALVRMARAASTGLSRQSINGATTTEAVIATFSDLISTVRASDSIWTEWYIRMVVSTTDAAVGATTGTLRVRRGTDATGEIIFQMSLTIPASKSGAQTVSVTRTLIQLQVPNLANTSHDFVITGQVNSAAGQTGTVSAGTSHLQMFAKSA